MVFRNFADEDLAEELIRKVKPVLEAGGLLQGVAEVYTRSRRPTVLFLRLRDKNAVTQTATEAGQAKIQFEGKLLWVNRARSKEERMRVRPVGKLIAQLRQARDLLTATLREGKDVEGGWRHQAEEVRVTTNKWKTNFVAGNMVEGSWEEVSGEQLQSALGCEWYTRLQ